MENKDLLYVKKEGVATITLNRPEKLNAFSPPMIRDLVLALKEAQEDHEVKAILLTGAGKAFCAGGDVEAMSEGVGFFRPDVNLPAVKPHSLHIKNTLWKLIQQVPLALENIDKPVIASVNGDAVGAGCDLALMCDIRITSDQARFSEGYVRLGLVPGDGGAYFLPRIVGVAKALEMLWTGDFIDAGEALRIGLVNKVVPAGELSEAAFKFARRLAQGPALAMSLTKRAVYQGLKTDLKTSLDLISSHMGIVVETGDHREGVRALLEKRKPDFKDV